MFASTRPYDLLTPEEKMAVNAAYAYLGLQLHDRGCPIDGDDTVQRVVDAIAQGVIDSRKPVKKQKQVLARMSCEYSLTLTIDEDTTDEEAAKIADAHFNPLSDWSESWSSIEIEPME